ncbi:ROK family transcriptional regulator [Govanella unica]|uniref:ROK family transcriptional regulator n=1 Tax=Govanella unica TaxID=2975056 RepID=A0A9X3TW50_9PROT|nr:ROK family transcriptional regulator [Govania unica]MDA5192824.1 ROK family transcriptional regulator [Govania unica]
MNSKLAENNRPPSAPLPELTRSERRILGLLFRRGPLTQAILSEATDLTQQSVSRLVSKLLDAGMLEPSTRIASGRRGYPSATVKIAPEFTYTFGISIMADAGSIAVMDFSGRILQEQRRAFSPMDMTAVIDWVKATIGSIRARQLPQNAVVSGAGVGISGSFIGQGVGFNTPYVLEDWAGIDLEDVMSKALGLPVWADNDGNVAALGESMIGVGRWAQNFAYLYIATGVGGGVILDGELWRGRHGNAGEFAGGLPSDIYPFPNLELLRQLVTRDGHVFSNVNDMVESFDISWPANSDWIARVRDSLSIIASNATAILDLDAIVFGGRIPRALAEKVIAQIELFDQKRRSVPRPTARLVPSEANGDAAAIGAALLPLTHGYFAKL